MQNRLDNECQTEPLIVRLSLLIVMLSLPIVRLSLPKPTILFR